MSRARFLDEKILELENESKLEKQKIGRELERLILKKLLKYVKCDQLLIENFQNSPPRYIEFHCTIDQCHFSFTLSYPQFYGSINVTFHKKNCVQDHRSLCVVKREFISTMDLDGVPILAVYKLIFVLFENLSDIMRTYDELYNFPVLEVRRAIVTVLCIHKYCKDSVFSILDKNVVKIICKFIDLEWLQKAFF